MSLVYREYAPRSSLAPFVRAYFTFGPDQAVLNDFRLMRSAALAGPSSANPTMIADVAASLVIKSGDEWSVDGVESSEGRGRSALVFGPMPKARATRIGPRLDAAGVYFRVGALCMFVDAPMQDIVGRGAPVCELLGEDAWEAIDAALEGSDSTSKLRILESILTSKLRDRSRIHHYRFARQIYREYRSSPALRATSAAAAKLGVSRQHLARQLRHSVGVSPNMMARIARFQSVLRSAAPGCSWAEIAAEQGYFDQSHLIADFRDFSSTTPAALVRAGQFHPYCA